MKITNARIIKTMLGLEDHGIPTFFLYLDYGSSEQGFGGYGLQDGSKKPIEYSSIKILLDILKVVGVDKWEDLPGKHIRVKREDGWNGKILGIGHILKDCWFDPTENQYWREPQ